MVKCIGQSSIASHIMRTSTPTRVVAAFIRFWNGDEGLVTLEWVGLAVAVILLAVGVISAIQSQANTAASSLGSKVAASTQSSQSDQSDGGHGQCSAPGLAIAASHANDHAALCHGQ
jgi:hypothetical protein